MTNIKSTENNYCIGCGKSNPIGLKLHFHYEEDGSAVTTSSLNKEYEGYEGIIHGGIVTLILDETCAKAVISSGYKGVTARMKISFIRPLYVGSEFVCRATAEPMERNRINVKGVLMAGEELKARCEAVFIKAGE